MAEGSLEGLKAIAAVHGLSAAALFYCTMAGMNGVELDQQVRELVLDILRIMITGSTDAQFARQEVTESEIFRLFTKPCTSWNSMDMLQAA